MRTVVITGSARGLGFEMAKQFIKNNFNVVICDILENKLEESKKSLKVYLTQKIMFYHLGVM